MSASLHPVSPGCGVEIRGVELARLSNSDMGLIRDAFHEHGVIFLRDQNFSREDHLAFARRWGEIVINEHFPELADTPEIAVVIKEADQKTNIGGGWHADHSYDPAPALGSILVARYVPECGGDTMFAHMARAFDTLSDGLKANLRSLRALHSSRQIYGPGGAYDGTDLKQVLKADGALSDAVHPVVIRHPETGREVLYVNPAHTIRFEGWTREESLPLLNHLYAHATKPEFTCRHRWTPGCVAMWDNRSTWHHALNDYHGQRREMHRITIAGTMLDAA
ncbi:MAG: alpha-ketoglutarate-dependent taurine dioxygenase [Minwuia thermotolerans]|nr:MAG: alpha-ketoglutarate-dependent taurine dioxygenase [Minwuia thermotolerans]